MSKIEWHQLFSEWRASVNRLSDIIGDQVRSAPVAGGFYSRRVAEAAAAVGIQVLFTSEPTTEIKTFDGCSVLGRFPVFSHTTAAEVARLACGNWRRTLLHRMKWHAKGLVKALGGPYYLKSRKWMPKLIDPAEDTDHGSRRNAH